MWNLNLLFPIHLLYIICTVTRLFISNSHLPPFQQHKSLEAAHQRPTVGAENNTLQQYLCILSHSFWICPTADICKQLGTKHRWYSMALATSSKTGTEQRHVLYFLGALRGEQCLRAETIITVCFSFRCGFASMDYKTLFVCAFRSIPFFKTISLVKKVTAIASFLNQQKGFWQHPSLLDEKLKFLCFF